MPDLKKMLTLEALSEALPSWLKRSTKPEYNADEIDSTLTTNQFVSASDKANWNAKGTYSKPSGGIPKSDLSSLVQTSLDKADSALQSETDPTVPSWAKQPNKPSYTQDEVADGSTYKRVTQNEKNTWSGKQNALTTIQMQAVNSGITAEGVTQISTNQTNVLYGLNTGVKNKLPCQISQINQSNDTGLECKYNEDGTYTVKGTKSTSDSYLDIANIYADKLNGDHVAYISVTGTGTCQIAAYGWNGTGYSLMLSTQTSQGFNVGNYTYVLFRIRFMGSVGTSYNATVKAMVCTMNAWNQSHDWQPPALPNHDLTRLEAEDRAALAEEIDAGAKNQLKLNGTQSSVYGLTVTWDYDNGTVKINGTVSGTTDPAAYIHLGSWTAPADGYYKLYAENANSSDIYVYNDATWGTSPASVYDSVRYFSKGTSFSHIYLRITRGYTANNVTIKPMICTKAAFAVSTAFVPYRPNYDAVSKAAMSAAFTHATIQNADLNSINKNYYGLYQNATNMPSGTSGFAFVRTTWFDSQAATQELTLLAATSNSYVRVKYGNAWTAWKQVTNA